ncbi:response regulator receiver domain protein (macronuclear) [Tetrahymena thermophila SB210]|uniref:Response regulator receiver domain protein n=1 Tax=Tetrahymena thermophila (strain SB210) TaxID=312017 RepID=Q23CU6_TETTS|nr:response regulator receiver domain protein [Tetrahymena thermophila SB210]EAR94432.2 response regulator receiver domain protein [Tetrahymena thermophila SB210]|eukprot:XP_001014940.2 response regulator receiver domain protein [Tetrahymena thermophila SB210]
MADVSNKKIKKNFEVNEVMNVFTLRFFDKNIQSHYQKNQERQLIINRKVLKGGLFLIGLGFFIDNILIDQNIIKSIQISSILIVASICLFVFERFILRYFSLIITIICITITIIDLSQNDNIKDIDLIYEHLWVVYNKGIILMTHVIVALSCVPEWYYRTAILASSTQFIFIGQFIINYYNNCIQIQVIFFIAVASFYFEEKRAKKMYYRKQMKKKELESWKLMLDQIVPVSVFVVNKESSQINQNSNTTTQPISQTNIIPQNINLDQVIMQSKMNIEFINKTCLKTFDIQSKEEFQQKLRKILVKKRYTQKHHINLKDIKIETPSNQNQLIVSPLFKRSPNSQNSLYRQDISLRTFNYRKNIQDLETYSKNLFKIIEQLRNPKQKLQLPVQQNSMKINLQADSISSKSNNNTFQIQNIHHANNSNNYQLDMTNTYDNQINQNPHLKQHQYLNCKYITYINSIQNGSNKQKERKIQYYDIRLIEAAWNGKDSIIGVITDVSEQVMAERKQEMMSYKNSVMNTITHDLKTPLNGIQLILGSSLEGNKTQKKELKESIKNALVQGHLLESRINDLLDYSKLVHAVEDSSDVKVNIDSFDINESILFCLSLYKQSACKKGINIFFNDINLILQPPGTKFPVLISHNDKQRFQQILINLVGNALKFTFQGYIKLQTEVQSPNELQISVVDTGIGMPQSLKINLQDKSQNFQFETRQPEKKNMRHGIGLGLDVSKRLIRLITKEDSLSVNSEQNLGTTITFKMLLNYENPVSKQILNTNNEQNNQSSIISSVQISTEKSASLNSNYHLVPMFNTKFIDKTQQNTTLKIMIVDDTSFNIIALQNYIQKILQGKCIIDVAYNGLQAINIYKKRLQEQRKKHPFQQIVFQESELHNKCDVSEFENSYLSDNIVNDINCSSEMNSQICERYKKMSSLGRKENFNLKSPYDTIFMDINMPIMDGYQAITTIRNLEKSCGMEYPSFIAVVTAFGEECDRQDSINIGANYHITKPLKQEQLKLILDCCKNQQIQNQL